MYLYRITDNKKEIEQYLKGNIYYNKESNLFNKTCKNSLYELNTFVYENKLYKHFYYFPLDAYEISKLLINNESSNSKKISAISILEYFVDNYMVYNKIGFGNYNGLRRKDYINKTQLYRITPYENSTYPVVEFRLEEKDNISITKKKWSFDKFTPFPNDLNNLKKLKQFIYYKLKCETILNLINVNYPHGSDGLMRISKYYDNIKTFEIPKTYLKMLY